MSVYKKLHQIQKNRLQVAKTCKANLGNGRVYEYASLDDVLAVAIPALNAAGLSLVQSVVLVGDTHVVRSEVVDIDTGDKVTSDIAMPVASKWHDFGSGMTYARRYSLSAMLGIACDADDDANVAMESQRHAEPPKKLNFFPIVQKFQQDLKKEGFEIATDEAVAVIYQKACAEFGIQPDLKDTGKRGQKMAEVLNHYGLAQFGEVVEAAKNDYMNVPGN